MIEIVITALIMLLALFILIKKFNNIKKGKCDCDSKNCNACPKSTLKINKKNN